MSDISNSVSKRLLSLLEANGYNVNSFSNKIGVKSTVLHYIIKGRKDGTKTKPSFEVLQKIVSEFNIIDSYWLITGVEKKILETSEKYSLNSSPHQLQKIVKNNKNGCSDNITCSVRETKDKEIKQLEARIADLESDKEFLKETLSQSLKNLNSTIKY